MSTKQTLVISATVEKIIPLHDKGFSVVMHTQEMVNEHMKDTAMNLLMMLKANVIVCISTALPSAVIEEEMSKLIAATLPDNPEEPRKTGAKSWSKQLRNCLYALWQKTELKESSEDFYERHMARFVSEIMEQIDHATPPALDMAIEPRVQPSLDEDPPWEESKGSGFSTIDSLKKTEFQTPIQPVEDDFDIDFDDNISSAKDAVKHTSVLDTIGLTDAAKEMFKVDEASKTITCYNEHLNKDNSSIIRDMMRLGYVIQYGIK